ncbi:hypothetical protein ACOMHN_018924 [Nucella lapillus]
MESALKPEDFSGPLKYLHQEDGAEQEGEGRRLQLSARGTRKRATQDERNARLKYRHLKEEDYECVSSLLQGSFQLSQVPRSKSKVIKMFISSTFKDLEVERNILAQQVFPKLRTYCRDKYGVDFQAVDMRWGISSGAKDDHSGAELCLAELAHCQNSSIGPNFALMLGQRYGFRQVPAAIVKSQFDAIRTHLVESGNDVTILDQCYLRDQNVIPSMYRLQAVSKITETTSLPWSNVESSLRQLVEDGAHLAVKASDLRQDEMRTLIASMTELEVYEGLINIQKEKDRRNNCIVFERQIDDLFEHLDHPLARRFCDVVSGDTETDGDAQTALHNLKLRSQRAVPSFNFRSTKVSWTLKGIDPEYHKEHIQVLTDHFYHTTRALVDRNMLLYDQLAADELYHEVVAHWNMVVGRCLTFVGREVPLMTICQYLSQESSQILVVHGESGVGKTSFLAKVTSLVNSWMAVLPNPMKTSLVVRFVGISAKCSTVQQLLYSICHQVAFVIGRPRQEVPEDYKSLKVYFIDLLQRGEVPGRLVILLDSLDQLSSNNGAHKLDWLPARIAPNVKIIVSALPNKYGILNRLKAKTDNSLLLQLSPLPATDAERIMKVLLDGASRQVTLPQWRLIQQAFQHCTLPLFITLTFQEAARWRSYDDIPPNALQQTIEASIQKLLERLEEKHGKTFVSHSLGYITAARRGLSESELEDVLSLDDEVLNSVFTFWEPPIRRIPPSLWPRLYLDIAAFLVERDADEVSVLSWYHQQFVDVATAHYLAEDNTRIHIYRSLAEYFQGAWSGSAQKPFTYSKQMTARLELGHDQGKACRFVPDMPLVFRSSEVSERFNLRKMSELPFALLFSYQFDLIRTACFCNYGWLHTKLRATSVQQVLADFALFDDPETDLVADVLRMSGSTLHQDPDRLGTEISGRLLPHVSRYRSIRELVKQCDVAAQMCCPLVPVAQLYAAPGGPLQYECDLQARTAEDVDVFSSPDGILMTAKSYHSTCLKVWELSQGEPRQDIHLPVGQVHPSADGRYLAILRERRHVSIYDANTGQIHGHVDYDYGEVGKIARSRKYLVISVERGFGPIIVDMEAASLVHRFNFLSRAVAISPDEKLLCFNTGHNLLLYSLPLMERKCVSEPCKGTPLIVQFAGDSSKCFVLTDTKMLQSVLFDPVNGGHRSNQILADLDMRDITLSHNQNLLLCRCGRWLYLIDAHRERKVHRLQPTPDGVFRMALTTFSGAGFTPDDRLVVASRHTYLFVWATNSGSLVRVLHAAVSPITKLFVSPATNKAVTMLQDHTLQVWNLNNIEADVLHSNEILKGAVKTLTLSTSAGLVACHGGGQGQPEVKLVDLGTGRVKDTLEQAPCVEHVSAVSFSPGGRYLLTWNVCVPGHTAEDQDDSGRADDGMETLRPPVEWPVLRRIVLWDVERRKEVYCKDNTRFAIFDRHGAGLAVVQCTFYSRFDWAENLYRILFVPLDSEISGSREVCFPLPELTEMVGCPVLYHDRRNHSWAFIGVLQFCRKTYPKLRGVEGPREFETVVFIQFLPTSGGQKLDTEPKIIRLSDLVRYPDENDRIAGVRVEATNLLLITYVKNVRHYDFDTSQGLVVPPDVDKGSVLYDLRKEVKVKHYMRVFAPSSDLRLLQVSSSSSICLDQHLQVFNMASKGKKLCQVDAEWTKASARLALDGHYVLSLSADCRSLQLCRSVDGALKGAVKLHGKGTYLDVAEDGRTIAVGTTDGRVLLLALVLELSDPFVELIRHLPSRNPPPPTPSARGTPELVRLSVKIRTEAHVRLNKRSSVSAITNAMMVAQRVQHARSQACCVQ